MNDMAEKRIVFVDCEDSRRIEKRTFGNRMGDGVRGIEIDEV